MKTSENTINKDTVIVGIDTHKYTHTAVFINSFGQKFYELNFDNLSIDKLQRSIDSLKNKDKSNVIVALEDAKYFGAHIAKQLHHHHDRLSVRHVPSFLSKRQRGRRNKNDHEDALSVAKTVLFDYESTLPLRHKYTEKAHKEQLQTLKLMIKEREDLNREITTNKNKAHALLHLLFGSDERLSALEKSLNKKRSLLALKEYFEKRMKESKSKDTSSASLCLMKIEKILYLEEKKKELDKEIERLSESIPEVQALLNNIFGCGVVLASTIVCEVEDISRFKSVAHFASYTATAPKERSSASKKRFVSSKMGNKTLNKALHQIVLAQISKDKTEGRVYFKKKLEEGKSKLWAMRSLKRHLARRVYKTLSKLN